MSMTREEAINWIENLRNRYSKQAEEYEKQGALIPMDAMYPYIQALGVAISALRPVSREQVEKVWRGEWIGDNDEKVGTIDGSPMKSATCFACGNWLAGSDEYDCSGHFCPACGRAMTDEAVQMVMERMEALKNESTTH